MKRKLGLDLCCISGGMNVLLAASHTFKFTALGIIGRGC
jgi:hypothetical protein